MSMRALLVLSILFFAPHVLSEPSNSTKTCVQWYENAVETYLENDWKNCVANFEKALDVYRVYRKKLKDCRLKCKSRAESSEPLYPVDIDNLLFYERAVRQTLCIMECEKDSPEILENYVVGGETVKLFEERKPYEYLHICYYQMKDIQKAASAAFTFLVSNPDDKVMSSNLKQYSEMEEVNVKKIVNFEAQDYVYLYVHGADAYENKDWEGVVNNMEESLEAYLQSEEECRALCEGPFDHGWYPDFIPSISNHFTVCLKCKQKCRKRLASLNGEIHDDLLPSHYHYLQYAYFKLDNLEAACRAVASYLLFYPDDATMLENMKYYSKLPKVRDDFFHPREEAIRYLQRHIYESRIMKFITNEFKVNGSSKAVEEESSLTYRVTMTEEELQGTKRFVSDGLASKRECRSLVEMAKQFAKVGDGYDGKKSPHTAMEKLEGITLGRAVFFTYFGLLHPKYVRLYLRVTEDVMKHVQEHFQTEEKLFFSYTQLVCRSALPESSSNRTDFSHKIHADNCNILKNGTCTKSDPAFTWRSYSAILYLNEDFDGGEFIFSSDEAGSNIQSTIEPKCGRMIAFSSGAENLHGVKAVKKGTRCALGLWFTNDPLHIEDDRDLARRVVENDHNFHSNPLPEITRHSDIGTLS